MKIAPLTGSLANQLESVEKRDFTGASSNPNLFHLFESIRQAENRKQIIASTVAQLTENLNESQSCMEDEIMAADNSELAVSAVHDEYQAALASFNVSANNSRALHV